MGSSSPHAERETPVDGSRRGQERTHHKGEAGCPDSRMFYQGSEVEDAVPRTAPNQTGATGLESLRVACVKGWLTGQSRYCCGLLFHGVPDSHARVV